MGMDGGGPRRPGTGAAGPVDCAGCRAELSARLDGADDPRVLARVDAHLAGCPACARWLDDAAAVTRLARLGLAVPAPGSNWVSSAAAR